MPRSPITTHVLDVSCGKPAAGIAVTLEAQLNGGWKQLASGKTDDDGRVGNLLPEGSKLEPGVYRLHFDVANYQRQSTGSAGFYPYVPIIFEVQDPSQHYHVPLLLSPFGYSTYRGS